MKVKNVFLFSCFLSFVNLLYAQTDPKDTEIWEPEPRVVASGGHTTPPSDAIILFDGKNLDEWQAAYGDGEARWIIENDAMTVVPGTGDIKTKRKFGDIQLHLEWRTPNKVEGKGQGRGNSGVFLQMRYELQILDSYQNRTYSNGQAGAVYKQHIPLVNVCKAPGEWQNYDIIFKAPRFNKDGICVALGTLTVLQNGVLIQNNVEIKGAVAHVGQPKNIAHGIDAIKLQDHGNPMSFRNIWVREL